MSETETLTASLEELRKSFDELQFDPPKTFLESGQPVTKSTRMPKISATA